MEWSEGVTIFIVALFFIAFAVAVSVNGKRKKRAKDVLNYDMSEHLENIWEKDKI